MGRNLKFRLPSYMLAVQDGEGCEQEKLVSIPMEHYSRSALGGDIEIKLGDSVQLFVEPTHPISIYNWYGADSLSCGDCLAPVVSAIGYNGLYPDRREARKAARRKMPSPFCLSPGGYICAHCLFAQRGRQQ